MGSTGTTHQAAIPRGSLVLVTGATGFVASHTIKTFLEHGFRVRGTVRNRPKAAFLSEGPFGKYAENGSLELVDVPDMEAEGAYKEAIRGVAAIVNVAANVNTQTTDPDAIIPSAVASLMGLLRTAAAEPSLKRFVHCSTIGTAASDNAGDHYQDDSGPLTRDSWNDEVVEQAYRPPPHGPMQGLRLYVASKVKSEKAAWKFVEEERPGFVFNTVHPALVLGPVFSKSHLSGSPGWLMALFTDRDVLADAKMAHVHVEDVALLHLAAAIDPEVKGERLFASVGRCDWNTLLALLRRLYPGRKFRDDLPVVPGVAGYTFDDTLELSMLKKWGGHGWIPLERSVRETVDSCL